MIHLVGFGVVGSVLAWHLKLAGIPFTWSDENSPYVAWRACTGSVLPTGEPLDMEGYEAWSTWENEPPWGKPGIIEPAAYLYNHLRPPEAGRFKQSRLGPFNLASIPSYHVNAQELVLLSREAFASQRRVVQPVSGPCIVTHGFSRLLSHLVWGWHALARVETSWPVALRPCFYLRHNRFRLTYAYPKPGTEFHYIGSDMIAQRQPRSLSIASKLLKWQKCFPLLAGKEVKISVLPDSMVEGWRPAPKEGLNLVSVHAGELCVRPLGHSGVRWSHSVSKAVLEQICR